MRHWHSSTRTALLDPDADARNGMNTIASGEESVYKERYTELSAYKKARYDSSFISMPSFSPPKADRLKPRALARMNLSAAEGGRGFSPKPPS